MGGTLHGVEGMQVVGQYAALEEALGEGRLRFHAVIDAAQDDALIEQGDAGALEASHGGSDGVVQLVGMVGVNDQHLLQTRGTQPAEQLVIDAVRNHHRQARVDAQALEMRDLAQRLHQPRQALVGGDQRVAAGQDHLVDALVGAQVVEDILPLRAAGLVVLIGEVTAEAVAAVDRAAAAGHQQHPVGVLVDQSRQRRMLGLFQRIGDVAVEHIGLGVQRQHLAQQWVVGVIVTNSAGIGLGNTNREQFMAVAGARKPFALQPQALQQSLWRADHVA